MTSEKGIWNHILTHCPIPERDEITSIVGRSLLNQNEVNS